MAKIEPKLLFFGTPQKVVTLKLRYFEAIRGKGYFAGAVLFIAVRTFSYWFAPRFATYLPPESHWLALQKFYADLFRLQKLERFCILFFTILSD